MVWLAFLFGWEAREDGSNRTYAGVTLRKRKFPQTLAPGPNKIMYFIHINMETFADLGSKWLSDMGLR